MSDEWWWIDSASEPTWGANIGGTVLVGVHNPQKCAGQPCVIHNPSDHHMRDWPSHWRGDRGLMERICEHGIGHPDPDDVAWHEWDGRHAQGVHGCDGCCGGPS